MQVLAFMSQKGGAGKSTLARQLAAIAGEEGAALLIDCDPQSTASKWWNRRQDLTPAPAQPDLLDLGGHTLTAAISSLKSADRPGRVFVDTSPAVSHREAEAAQVADLVIVPVRPSGDDLEAVGDTLAMLRRLDRRAAIVVNAAKSDSRAIEARAALSVYPVPVCPIHLGDRAIYQDAAAEGRGVHEMRGQSAARATAELRGVWQWIKEIEQ